MKFHLVKWFSALLFLTQFFQIAWATPPPKGIDICDALVEGKFLRQVSTSVSIAPNSILPDLIDRNSGTLDSELVATFKPILKVSAAGLAQGLNDCIKNFILSPTFIGAASVRRESDKISTVSVYGTDHGMRVRIEADVVTLSDGSVRLKIICLMSKEAE